MAVHWDCEMGQDLDVNKLGPLGAEPLLSETFLIIQQTVHRFAFDVMRPAGIALDRMTPDQVIVPGLPD